MEIANFKKLLVLICPILLNCNNEDQVIKNRAPKAFEIDVTEISFSSTKINWTESLDPEGSIVFYDVYLTSNKLADNITDLSFDFNNLIEGKTYEGKVVASDPEGNTLEKNFSFETSLNQLPTQFITTVVSVNPYHPKIVWSTSTDPEGGSIKYKVYLNDELKVETNQQEFTFESLKGLNFYNGYVEAIDEDGKVRVSNFSFTTEIKIYNSDLFLENQAEVDDFGLEGFNLIEGNLVIGSLNSLNDISSLEGLHDVQSVQGNVYIRNTACQNLMGLHNISQLNQFVELIIVNNRYLERVDGLNSIENVYRIYIETNEKLLNLDGLSNLKSATKSIGIVNNQSLNSIIGLANVSILGEIQILNNDSLTSLIGLEGVNSISREVHIYKNKNLQTIQGLDNLIYAGELIISDNESLTNLNNLSNLEGGVSIRIINNDQLLSLSGLEKLKAINHTMIIANNDNLETLSGIENVLFTDNNANYHALGISGNPKITNLDPLENYTFNKGPISIFDNSTLTDFCGLTKIINEIEEFTNYYNFATNNAYNPSMQDILDGNCFL